MPRCSPQMTIEVRRTWRGHLVVTYKRGRVLTHGVLLSNPPVRLVKLHDDEMRTGAFEYNPKQAMRAAQRIGRNLGITAGAAKVLRELLKNA